MKLRINNASKAADDFILPLIRFAARFFNVSGRVTVNFSETKKVTETWKSDPRETKGGAMLPLIPAKQRQKLFSGYCAFSTRNISVCSTLNESHPGLPFARSILGYWPGSKIPVAPYEFTTPEEIIIHVAAHEFAHLMARGQNGRRSRQEVFCENKATTVLDAFRTEDGQAWIAAERARMKGEPVTVNVSESDSAELIGAKIALAIEDDPRKAARALEIVRLHARRKTWESKAKRAANALRKINRKLKRLEAASK